MEQGRGIFQKHILRRLIQDRCKALGWRGPGLVKSRPGLECGKEERERPGKFRQNIRASGPWFLPELFHKAAQMGLFRPQFCHLHNGDYVLPAAPNKKIRKRRARRPLSDSTDEQELPKANLTAVKLNSNPTLLHPHLPCVVLAEGE